MERKRTDHQKIISRAGHGRPCWIAAALASGSQALQPVSLVSGNDAAHRHPSSTFQSFNTEMLEVTGGRFWNHIKTTPPESSRRQ